MTYEQLTPERREIADKIRNLVLEAERRHIQEAVSDATGFVSADENRQYPDTTSLEMIPQAS